MCVAARPTGAVSACRLSALTNVKPRIGRRAANTCADATWIAIERPNGMYRDERFGASQNVDSNFDERPVGAVDRDVPEYRWKTCRID